MWGQPPRLSTERSEGFNRVERALLSAAFDLDFAFAFDPWANCPERSDRDEAGQFVDKRAGAPQPWRRKEQSEDQSDGEGACRQLSFCEKASAENKSGRPQAARLVQAKS